jgi:hypothetical protein
MGPNDGAFVSIDIPETLILAFTNNTANDGAGADLQVYGVVNGDSRIDVYGSQDNVTCTFLGRINGNAAFDLSRSGPAYVNYLKFVGLDNRGTSAGFDLDALEALNSIDLIPVPGAVVLGGIGVGLVGWLRRRRTL